MPVPPDIERLMDKTRAKREAANAKAVVAATKAEIKSAEKTAKGGRVLLVVACLALATACQGPKYVDNLNNAPLTPVTTPAVGGR